MSATSCHVDCDLLLQSLRIGLVEGTVVRKPGVVDNAGDVHAEPLHLGGQRLPGAVGGQVHVHDVHLDPVLCAQLLGELLQALPAAGDQHQVRAALGEPAGELHAEPRTGPGDQRGLPPVVDGGHDDSPFSD